MRKLQSLKSLLLTFVMSMFIASCSQEFTEIEDRIRVQAEKNNTELSDTEIKKTAAEGLKEKKAKQMAKTVES